MASVQSLGGPVGEACGLGQRIDLGLCLDLAELERDRERPLGGVEHLAQLQLAGMEIEPPQRVGQHVGRQDADRDAVFGA